MGNLLDREPQSEFKGFAYFTCVKKGCPNSSKNIVVEGAAGTTKQCGLCSNNLVELGNIGGVGGFLYLADAAKAANRVRRQSQGRE